MAAYRAKRKKYAKGAVIIEDGVDSRVMFWIVKGRVGLYERYRQPGEKNTAILQAGACFGETSLFKNRKSAATAVALDDAIVMPVDQQGALVLFRKHPDVAYAVIASALEKLDAVAPADAAAEPKIASAEPSTDAKSVSLEVPGVTLEPTATATADAMLSDADLSPTCSLFPPEHGNYALRVDQNERTYLTERSYDCPFCKSAFREVAVRSIRLIQTRTDPDSRVHYRGIEPSHYDVVTCPSCWYSALGEAFATPDPGMRTLGDALLSYRSEFTLKPGADRDTFSVFAGYYLALKCAPLSFRNPQTMMGKLWVKLSRLYSDCGDQRMERYAAAKAQSYYLYAYEHVGISNAQAMRVCLILASLYYKLDDLKESRNFYVLARSNHEASGIIKQQIDDRLEEIRERLRETAP